MPTAALIQLSLDDIHPRLDGDARPLKPDHVLWLATSIAQLGLLLLQRSRFCTWTLGSVLGFCLALTGCNREMDVSSGDVVEIDSSGDIPSDVVTAACTLDEDCAAQMSCESGECVCAEGFDDCNGEPADGCEAGLASDDQNCGACGAACGDDQFCGGLFCQYAEDPHTISCGDQHTCAIRECGQVYCWGQNTSWEVGVLSRDYQPRPVAVPGVDNAVQISAAGSHSCALLEDGKVSCWGSNRLGQLGRGNITEREAPALVDGITDAISVRSGGLEGSTCVVHETGEVSCWGNNRLGQIGDGTRDNAPAPVKVAGLSDVVQVSVGNNVVCARKSTGQIWCWGSNSTLQIAESGSPVIQPYPVEVIARSDTKRVVSTYGGNGCAILQSGRLICWGYNEGGQLLLDPSIWASHEPVLIDGVTDVVDVGGGYDHVCALTREGVVYCWGKNTTGQLGSGAGASNTALFAAEPVTSLEPALEFSIGGNHGCALMETGELRCWGNNQSGQLGAIVGGYSLEPVTVGALP